MIQATGKSRYWRPVRSLIFYENQKADKHLFAPLNFVAKKIGVCPQATAREALMLGIKQLAKNAEIDLSMASMTEDDSADIQRQSSYQDEQKSQE